MGRGQATGVSSSDLVGRDRYTFAIGLLRAESQQRIFQLPVGQEETSAQRGHELGISFSYHRPVARMEVLGPGKGAAQEKMKGRRNQLIVVFESGNPEIP